MRSVLHAPKYGRDKDLQSQRLCVLCKDKSGNRFGIEHIVSMPVPSWLL